MFGLTCCDHNSRVTRFKTWPVMYKGLSITSVLRRWCGKNKDLEMFHVFISKAFGHIIFKKLKINILYNNNS